MGPTINTPSGYCYYTTFDEIIIKQDFQTKQHCRRTSQFMQEDTRLQEQRLRDGGGRGGDECKSNQKSNKRILVVDDEPDACLSYQLVLQGAGYQCKSYTDSVKALQEFRPALYELIILDIKMPVLNGFELCKRIREIDNTAQIIFITASKEYNKLRRESYPELGSIVSIQKPIENEQLIKVVNNAITLKDEN